MISLEWFINSLVCKKGKPSDPNLYNVYTLDGEFVGHFYRDRMTEEGIKKHLLENYPLLTNDNLRIYWEAAKSECGDSIAEALTSSSKTVREWAKSQ